MSIRERIERILMLACIDGKRRETATEGILAAFVEELPEEKVAPIYGTLEESNAFGYGFNLALTEIKSKLGVK